MSKAVFHMVDWGWRIADGRIASGPSTIHHRPSAIRHRPSAIRHHASAIHHPQSAINGFTLIELLVASTITAMIAAAAVIILNQVGAAQQRIHDQVDLQQQGQAAITSIAAAFRNAYRPSQADHRVLIAQDHLTLDNLPRDEVMFFTVSRRHIREGQPESDVREVEFSILDPGTGEPPALMRRSDPTIYPDVLVDAPSATQFMPRQGGVVERVADHIVGLNITYYDADTGQWQDGWDSRVQGQGWPEVVRIRVIVQGDGGNDTKAGRQTWSLSRLIEFPGLAESNEESTAGQETTDQNQAPEQDQDTNEPSNVGMGGQQ